MKRVILVVCRGNIARSPFAEVVINRELIKRKLDEEYVAISRGTQGTEVDPKPVEFPNITFYKDHYRDSKPTLDKLDIDITKHISKPVDREVVQNARLILAVDEEIKTGLVTLFPDLKDKIYLLSELIGKEEDVIDPGFVGGIETHRRILTGIQNTIIKGFPKLLELAELKSYNCTSTHSEL